MKNFARYPGAPRLLSFSSFSAFSPVAASAQARST
jgi:hypothetical protein